MGNEKEEVNNNQISLGISINEQINERDNLQSNNSQKSKINWSLDYFYLFFALAITVPLIVLKISTKNENKETLQDNKKIELEEELKKTKQILRKFTNSTIIYSFDENNFLNENIDKNNTLYFKQIYSSDKDADDKKTLNEKV